MRLVRMLKAAVCASTCLAGLACSQTVNPATNPLIGNWVYSSGGYPGAKYGCAKTRSFSAHSQTFEAFDKIQTRDVHAYAVEGTKIYVQERLGSGGTTAYTMIGRNEMMDDLGTYACHWKRQ